MTEPVNRIEEDPLTDRSGQAGFVMLALAQLVSIFAFWMGLWPAAFGLPRGSQLSTVVAIGFALAGAFGFYLAFQQLKLS